jgi:hypothetical protein
VHLKPVQKHSGIEKWIAYYNAERPHYTHAIWPSDEATD